MGEAYDGEQLERAYREHVEKQALEPASLNERIRAAHRRIETLEGYVEDLQDDFERLDRSNLCLCIAVSCLIAAVWIISNDHG